MYRMIRAESVSLFDSDAKLLTFSGSSALHNKYWPFCSTAQLNVPSVLYLAEV